MECGSVDLKWINHWLALKGIQQICRRDHTHIGACALRG